MRSGDSGRIWTKIVLVVAATALLASAGLWTVSAQQARRQVQLALSAADAAMAAGQVDQARHILETAISEVSDLPGSNDIVAPAKAKLAQINRPSAPVSTGPVIDLVLEPTSQGADSPQQEQNMEAAAPSQPQPAEPAAAVPQMPTDQSAQEPPPQPADAAPQPVAVYSDPAGHEQFLQYHSRGVAAMEQKDYPAAVAAFQEALKYEDDAGAFELLQKAIEKSEKPRLAVLDFTVSGDVGIPQAGQSVAQLLLPRFGADRYALVERTHLNQILTEQDLSMSQLVDNPKIIQDNQIRSVRYLVLGTVVRLGNLSVSARLVDAQTAEIVQTAEISADTPEALQDALGDLALMLQMTADEKVAFLRDREVQAQQQAQQEAQMAAQELAQHHAQIEAQRRARYEQELAWRQHNEQAFALLAQVQGQMARGDFGRSALLARAGLRDFADTAYAQDFSNLYQQSQREMVYAREARERHLAQEQYRREMEQRHRHDLFLKYCQNARDAIKRGDRDAAIEAYRKALEQEDDRQTRAALAELTAKPKLVVTARLKGKDYRGAKVYLDGKLQNDTTPLTLTLTRGRSYEIGVTIAPRGDNTYSLAKETLTADWTGPRTIRLDVQEVLALPVPPANKPADPVHVDPPHVSPKPSTPRPTTQSTQSAAPSPKPGPQPRPQPERREVVPAPQPVAPQAPAPTAPRPAPRQPVTQPAPTPAPPAVAPPPSQPQRDETPQPQSPVAQPATTSVPAAPAKPARPTRAPREQDDSAQGKTDSPSAEPSILEVTATAAGKALRQAVVTVDGRVVANSTPARITLQRGKSYQVEVSCAPRDGKSYTTASTTITIDRPGVQQFQATLDEIQAQPDQPTPAPTPQPARPTGGKRRR